VLAMVTGS
jgi:hypothetical protein